MPEIPSRRHFLGRAGVLTAGAGLAVSGIGQLTTAGSAFGATGPDYATREMFDHFDRTFHGDGRTGQPYHNNEAGALTWGQSYVLMGFLQMYLATADTHYLDRLVENVDIMLTVRDSVRGVTDYRGLSLPAWRAMNPYTLGTVTLPDGDGAPTLEFRTALAYADTATVTVTHGDGDSFSCEIHSAQYNRGDSYPNLTMDEASSNYAVRRIYDEYPSSLTRNTAAAVGTGGRRPAEGTYQVTSEPFIFAVHTGMITYPLARFARLVLTSPRLRAVSLYRNRARTYLRAVEDAVAIHDREWGETDDGRGYYRWAKGSAIPFDGLIQPINQYLALGRTLLELARITKREPYVSRAAKLALGFRNDIFTEDQRTSLFYYWPTFSELWNGYEQTGDPETDLSLYTPHYRTSVGGNHTIDDVSHAAISVDFAAVAYHHQVVFNQNDLRSMARTFTENLATVDDEGRATVFQRINGTNVATSGYYLQAPRWMAVAPYDSRLFPHARAIYNDHDPGVTFGSGLLAVANLVWGARHAS